MKKLNILFTLLVVFASSAFAQDTWKFDASHTKIQFTVSHMTISEVSGDFKKFDGSVTTKSDGFKNADVDFTIQVKSIDTDNEKRDGHLVSPDFFNAKKYPEIKFESKSFKKVSGNKYKLTGDLTMKGTTREVGLSAKHNGTVKDPMSGKTKAGFKVTGEIDRTEWGIDWNKNMDNGMLVGEKVAIRCDVELVKQ